MICSYSGETLHAESSVIRVLAVRPLRLGKRLLELDFYHANYPDGVRSKTYLLKVLMRQRHLLTASLDDGSDRQCLLIIQPLSRTFVRQFFPAFEPNATSLEQIVAALERDFNGGS